MDSYELVKLLEALNLSDNQLVDAIDVFPVSSMTGTWLAKHFGVQGSCLYDFMYDLKHTPPASRMTVLPKLKEQYSRKKVA